MARGKLTTRQFVRMSHVLMDEGHLEDRSPGDMTEAELLREWRRAFGKDAAVPDHDADRQGNPTGAQRFALAHFDVAAERSERNMYAARDALGRLAAAADEYERRAALVDVLESLTDASYALGMAEGHLLHAGRLDPMKVPRFRQLVGLFAETWEGARASRVANFTDRGRAAIAAGLTSVAGAIIGGALLGPAGAMAGSVVGGAAGPYAFMREHRDPDDLEDAVIGGGVGGIFTPVGAALGAYWAGDELARAPNRRKSNRKIRLPKRGEPPLVIESHGRKLVVQPGEQRGEWVSKVGSRVRWGTRRETLEDIEHFEYMGMLPAASPGTWANQKRKRNGWIGDVDAVQHYLSTVGADQDEDDRYVIGGDPPIYGIGGDEIVISDDTVYYVDGRPVPLAAALVTTGSGVPVKVFNDGRVRNMDADTAVDRINDALVDKDWVEFEEASEDLFDWIRRGGSPPSRTVDWRYLDRAYRCGDVDERSYEWLLDINKRSAGELPLVERLRNC